MNECEFDFDTEFMSDEEVDEMLDNIIISVAEQAAAEDNRTSIINPYQINRVVYTYRILKYLTRGTKAKVTYTLHEPYKSMGVVSIVGSDLMFRNTEWFIKAIEFASNFNVYPKTDGTVQIDFTFHGLTKAID